MEVNSKLSENIKILSDEIVEKLNHQSEFDNDLMERYLLLNTLKKVSNSQNSYNLK